MVHEANSFWNSVAPANVEIVQQSEVMEPTADLPVKEQSLILPMANCGPSVNNVSIAEPELINPANVENGRPREPIVFATETTADLQAKEELLMPPSTQQLTATDVVMQCPETSTQLINEKVKTTPINVRKRKYTEKKSVTPSSSVSLNKKYNYIDRKLRLLNSLKTSF